MKPIGRVLTLGLAAALAVSAVVTAPAARAADSAPAPAAARAQALTGGTWQLESMGSADAQVDALAGADLTLTFGSAGQASGSGGCNQFNGAYQPGDSSLTFGPLVSTKLACADEALTQQETAYLAALQAVTSYQLDGDHLILTGPVSVLHFARPTGSAEPTPPAVTWQRAQFGTSWDLGHPAGWTIDAAGAAEGALQLHGPWQGHTFKVTLSYPIGAIGASFDDWVWAQLDPLPGSPADFAMTNLFVAGVPARLVRSVPAADEPTPRHLVYLWRTAATQPRLVAVTQVDGQAYDAALMADFAQAFVAQLRDPQPVGSPAPETPTTPVTNSAEARVPGIIDYHSDGTAGVLTAPATVAVGQAFTVTIATYGGGCERAADAAAIVGTEGALLLAYDFTRATQPDVVCTAILQRLTHTVTLRFDQPGEMVLRLWGRRVGPETSAAGVPTMLEHTITVQ